MFVLQNTILWQKQEKNDTVSNLSIFEPLKDNIGLLEKRNGFLLYLITWDWHVLTIIVHF